jgi:hypothetical protein
MAMNIIPPSPLGIIRSEYQIIRRFMLQREEEWREKRGVPRLLAKIRVYFWARREAMPLIGAKHASRRIY